MHMKSQLLYTNPASWTDIFDTWESQEGSDPVWQRFAKEEKGWDFWRAWREHQASYIDAQQLSWQMYTIRDPNTFFPNVLMGPYKGWQSQYPESEYHIHTFQDLVRDHLSWVESNPGIRARAEHIPMDTQYIGIYAVDEDAIILYEGHHRAAAITLRMYRGNPIVFTSLPKMALTTMDADQVAHFRSQISFSAKAE